MFRINITTVVGDAALLIPGYERDPPVAPGDCDCLILGYRLSPAALMGNPYSGVIIVREGQGI